MATTTERAEIRAKHPDSWVAVEVGDFIRGKLTDVTEGWSDQRTNNGRNQERGWYPLLTVAFDDAPGYSQSEQGGAVHVPTGELKVHCFGAVLENEVLRHQPEVGETLTITYKGTGEQKKRGQNPPELYALRVEGRTDQAQRVYGRLEQHRRGGISRTPTPTEQGEQAPIPQPEDMPDW